MIVFIGLNASLSILDVKVKLSQLLKYGFVNWNPMITDYDPTVKRNIFFLFTPLVIKNLLNSESFTWIHIKYLFKEIFERFTHKIWENIFT